jgi:sirohydrochlorin ferrochelatase
VERLEEEPGVLVIGLIGDAVHHRQDLLQRCAREQQRTQQSCCTRSVSGEHTKLYTALHAGVTPAVVAGHAHKVEVVGSPLLLHHKDGIKIRCKYYIQF